MHRNVVAVNHVGISVADLDAARSFWTDGLGAIDHGGWSWPIGTTPADESLATVGTAAEVALLRTDSAYLELFAFSAPVPARRPPDAPGVRALAWAVDDVANGRARALAAGGSAGDGDDHVVCPDGTQVRLVPSDHEGCGLVGVEVAVVDPDTSVLGPVPGPVALEVIGGADADPARPVDLGVNHLCLDVTGIDDVRAELDGMRWHHDITESSGGIAAVCYGTSADGVVVELLESRSPEAFLARGHLTRP